MYATNCSEPPSISQARLMFSIILLKWTSAQKQMHINSQLHYRSLGMRLGLRSHSWMEAYIVPPLPFMLVNNPQFCSLCMMTSPLYVNCMHNSAFQNKAQKKSIQHWDTVTYKPHITASHHRSTMGNTLWIKKHISAICYCGWCL